MSTPFAIGNGKSFFVNVVEQSLENPVAIVSVSSSQKKMKETSSLTTEFWLGFQTLNTIAKNNGSSKVPLISVEDLVKRGITQKESAETFEALPPFTKGLAVSKTTWG